MLRTAACLTPVVLYLDLQNFKSNLQLGTYKIKTDGPMCADILWNKLMYKTGIHSMWFKLFGADLYFDFIPLFKQKYINTTSENKDNENACLFGEYKMPYEEHRFPQSKTIHKLFMKEFMDKDFFEDYLSNLYYMNNRTLPFYMRNVDLFIHAYLNIYSMNCNNGKAILVYDSTMWDKYIPFFSNLLLKHTKYHRQKEEDELTELFKLKKNEDFLIDKDKLTYDFLYDPNFVIKYKDILGKKIGYATLINIFYNWDYILENIYNYDEEDFYKIKDVLTKKEIATFEKHLQIQKKLQNIQEDS